MWKVFTEVEVPKKANLLEVRSVLAIKDSETRCNVCKARFFVQRYRDDTKASLLLDSANVRSHSVRILVGLAAVFGFWLIWTDATQVYLQTVDTILRGVYINPSKEFELSPNHLLDFLKSLYSLADDVDCWGGTFLEHLQRKFGMQSTFGGETLFFKKTREQLDGICATYDDDLLQRAVKFSRKRARKQCETSSAGAASTATYRSWNHNLLNMRMSSRFSKRTTLTNYCS